MSLSRDKDSGWAWVVLAACATCVMMTSGLAMLAGMFQKVFLEELEGGVVMTSWITSLFASLMQLAGPVTGVVCSVFSCRTSVMTGALLLTAGFLLSSFAQNLTALLLAFGICCGLGLGLIYSAAIVTVNLSFLRYRSLATGSVLAAGGLGIMLMPILCRFLFGAYSWRETLAIFAAFSAQLVVAGALLFPVAESNRSVGGVCRNYCCSCFENRKLTSSRQHEMELSEKTRPLLESSFHCDKNDSQEKEQGREHVEEELLCRLCSNLETSSGQNNRSEDSVHFHQHRYRLGERSGQNTENALPTAQGNVEMKCQCSHKVVRAELHDRTYTNLHNDISGGQDEEIQKTATTSAVSKGPKLRFGTWRQFISVLTNRSLLLLCLQLCLSNAAIGIVLVHFVEYSLQTGSDFSIVSLGFSVNGMTLTLARFLMGALVQDRHIDPLSVYVGLALVTSLLLVTAPVVAVTPSLQISLLGAFGIYCGSSYSLLTEITIHCTGMDTLSLAFGMEMISAGMGYLVTPPLAGWLVVLTNSYSNAIFLAGFFYLVSAFVAMAISVTRPVWKPPETVSVEVDVQESLET